MLLLLGLCCKVGNEIVPVLGLLQTTKSHLGAWDVLLWVLEILELILVSNAHQSRLADLTRVSLFHSMPFCLFASE